MANLEDSNGQREQNATSEEEVILHLLPAPAENNWFHTGL